MEIINGLSMPTFSTLPLHDGKVGINDTMVLEHVFLNQRPINCIQKRKGRILIQDNIKMIHCNCNCGKYIQHK